ncbi:hypothetical protein [Thalassotalea crassostreae]|nr:hypothetical protein [Thalassotalea crassostreae]
MLNNQTNGLGTYIQSGRKFKSCITDHFLIFKYKLRVLNAEQSNQWFGY